MRALLIALLIANRNRQALDLSAGYFFELSFPAI